MPCTSRPRRTRTSSPRPPSTTRPLQKYRKSLSLYRPFNAENDRKDDLRPRNLQARAVGEEVLGRRPGAGETGQARRGPGRLRQGHRLPASHDGPEITACGTRRRPRSCETRSTGRRTGAPTARRSRRRERSPRRSRATSRAWRFCPMRPWRSTCGCSRGSRPRPAIRRPRQTSSGRRGRRSSTRGVPAMP